MARSSIGTSIDPPRSWREVSPGMALSVHARDGRTCTEVVSLARGRASPLGAMGPDTLANVWCGLRPVITSWLLRALAGEGLGAETLLDELLPASLGQLEPFAGATLGELLDHRLSLPPIGLLEAHLWGRERDRLTEEHLAAWARGHFGGAADQGGQADYSEHVVPYVVEVIARRFARTDDLLTVLPPGIAVPAIDGGVGPDRSDVACYHDQVDGTFVPLPHDLLPGMRSGRPLSQGGYASARGLASWYGRWLGPPAGWPAPARPSAARAGRWYSRTLLREVAFDRGCMVDIGGYLDVPACSPSAFGHIGFTGSSVGFADPDLGVAVGLVLNTVDVGHDRFFAARRDLLEWALTQGRPAAGMATE